MINKLWVTNSWWARKKALVKISAIWSLEETSGREMISSLKLHKWSDNQIKCVRCAPRKYDFRQSEYQRCYQHGEVWPDPERIQALKVVDKANWISKSTAKMQLWPSGRYVVVWIEELIKIETKIQKIQDIKNLLEFNFFSMVTETRRCSGPVIAWMSCSSRWW